MPKNCLEEYLTESCAKCAYWSDGTKEPCTGCCAPFPIMECNAFADMYNRKEREKEEKIISSLKNKIIFLNKLKYKAAFPVGSRIKEVYGEIAFCNAWSKEMLIKAITNDVLKTWRVELKDINVDIVFIKNKSYKDLEGKVRDYTFHFLDDTKKVVAAENLISAVYYADVDYQIDFVVRVEIS